MDAASGEQSVNARRHWAWLVALVALVAMPVTAWAQPASPEGAPVARVEITGNDRVSSAYIRARIETARGRPFSVETAERDQRQLMRTGKFSLVTYAARREQDEVVVTFSVTEHPQVRSIDFVGNTRFSEKELRDELGFIEGDPLDLVAVERGRANIERLYRESGRYFVDVSVDQARLKEDQAVIYTIVEGPRVRVRRIFFEGNTAFPDRVLNQQIATKTYIWIFRTGEFDADRLIQDERSLIDYYRRRGFLDVRVTHRLEFSDDREDLTIIFQIVEGTHYRIRNIHFRGNTVFTSEELLAAMESRPGQFFDAARLERDREAIQRKYGESGYIDRQVIVEEPVFVEDEPDVVDATFVITEGNQIHVGLIDIEGNQRTQDKVVRRELRFFPGEIYNTTAMEESTQRLVETQLFTQDTTIEAVGVDERVRDARVRVVESERQGNVMFGAGVTSDSGVVGRIALTHRNFDLFDWPRSFSELFKLQAFRGAGQFARIQFEPSTEFTRFRIDFREPYLLDQPLSFGIGLYLFERGRDAYTERRGGLDFSFRRKLERGWLKEWLGEVGFRTEWIGVDGINFFDAPDIRDVEGDNFLTSIRGALVHDTTDSFFLPSRGHRLTLSWEQVGALGGDFFFSKAGARFEWHRTLRVDEFDRKSILTLRAQLDHIFGDAPVFERYYAGGIGSMRGFDFRGVSPRDGLFDDRVGGDFRILTGASYSFPIYGRTLRGVIFTDMGTVEESFGITSWRASVGAGLRLQLDLLGPVPFELDLAVPVARTGDDDERIFNFLVGTSF